MEREFPLWVMEERPGRVWLSWDDLRLTAQATLGWQREGLWKVTLAGEGGSFLLGTLVPEGGRLLLRRTLTLDELRRAGAWPVQGARLSFRCPYDGGEPFPMPALFCFALWDGEGVWVEFDEEGRPKMPV